MVLGLGDGACGGEGGGVEVGGELQQRRVLQYGFIPYSLAMKIQ